LDFPLNSATQVSGSNRYYLLKRWKKTTKYNKFGEYSKSNNLKENLYNTSSTYLYDYIVVTDTYYNSLVYTSDETNSDPSETSIGPNQYFHKKNTFKNTPNSIYNNINATAISAGPSTIYSDPVFWINSDEYLEIVKGYPRNHYTHKRQQMSNYRIISIGTKNGSVVYSPKARSRQTISTTVGTDGLEDGSLPVESITVGNLNLIQKDNVVN